MRNPEINDLVVLLEDVPDLGLEYGDVGRVRNRWGAPRPAYEVEFYCDETNSRVRAVLAPERVQLAPLTRSPIEPSTGKGAFYT